MLNESRCECFNEIVEEVIKRLSQKRTLTSAGVQNAVIKGVEYAIHSAIHGIDEARPKHLF